MPKIVPEMTPGPTNCAAHLFAASWVNLNAPPEFTQNRGQYNPNLNDYHSDPMEVGRACWIPDITPWWHQGEETHYKCTDHSNVARDISSILPHGIGVEASFSVLPDVIVCGQSKSTGETLHK